MKRKSPTCRAAVTLTRDGGIYDGAAYIGQARDGANIYICTLTRATCLGLPAFIKARDGKAHVVTQGTAEYDECFEVLASYKK